MDFLKDVVLLLIGFVLLIKGADFFVDGSANVARLLKIPSVIVGLTIVSIGTSLPELSVSVTAALKGNNGIAISNVLGSNLANLLIVLGACAIITPIAVEKKIIKKDYPISIIITVILAVMFTDGIFKAFSSSDSIGAAVSNGTLKVGTVSKAEGVILFLVLIGYITYQVVAALKERKNNRDEENEKTINPLLSIVFIIGGIAAIKFGGDFVVNSASNIALRFGMSDVLVGLTIVAVGTSLPELVTSMVAAKKKETGLAVGNVIGSNIFNIVLILGVSGMLNPMVVTMQSFMDILFLILSNIMVYVFVCTRRKLERKEGIIMVFVYFIYMIYAILR